MMSDQALLHTKRRLEAHFRAQGLTGQELEARVLRVISEMPAQPVRRRGTPQRAAKVTISPTFGLKIR